MTTQRGAGSKRKKMTAKERVLKKYPHCMVLTCSGYNPETYPRTSRRISIWSACSIPPAVVIGEGKTRALAWSDAARRLR